MKLPISNQLLTYKFLDVVNYVENYTEKLLKIEGEMAIYKKTTKNMNIHTHTHTQIHFIKDERQGRKQTQYFTVQS